MTIRSARPEDLPTIYALVRELAVYEKEPEALTATLETYQKEFTKHTFDALVAEVDGRVIGMALYYLTFSTWKGRMLYLEDFVVAPTHRNQGIGSKLLDAFFNKARELNCVMVKWQVLDWNEHATRLYERKGAIVEQQWWNCKLFLD